MVALCTNLKTIDWGYMSFSQDLSIVAQDKLQLFKCNIPIIRKTS